GYPHAHEDQAERALCAALAIVDAVPRLDTAGERLAVRIGVATGLVVVGDLLGTVGGENQVVGDTPNLAARLQTLAAPNTALIDPASRQLVGELFEYRDLGAVEVKGYDQPVAIWQVIRSHVAGNRFEGLRRTAATPLIGRNDEIETLLRQWERAKTGHGRV